METRPLARAAEAKVILHGMTNPHYPNWPTLPALARHSLLPRVIPADDNSPNIA